MKFNYRIVSDDEVLLELEDMDISFIDMTPVQNSHQAYTMYAGIKTAEELAEYDGVFSVYASPFQPADLAGLNKIYEVLTQAEYADKPVEILVQPTEMDGLKDLPEVNFTPILNKTKVELVTKILRTESVGIVTTIVFMVYKN